MPFTLADRPLVRTSPRTMLSGPLTSLRFCCVGQLLGLIGSSRFENAEEQPPASSSELHQLVRNVDSDVGAFKGLPQRGAGRPKDLARDGAVCLKERVHRVAQIREVLE